MDNDKDLVELREVVYTLWRGKWIIAITTAGCAAVALAYALLATEIYRSEALVQPREPIKAGARLAGLAAQFGGLADITGVSLASGGDKAVAVATLQSRTLIERFVQEKNLLTRLYGSDWDAATGQWKGEQPTVWEAYNDFVRDVLEVKEDRKSGLVTVAIEWKDPIEAQEWVTELVERANAHLRSVAIREAEANLAYLGGQASNIQQVEVQQSVYRMVESELNKLMLAKGGEEFALKTVDAAVVPVKRVRPKRTLIAVIGVLFGSVAGMAAVLLQTALRGEPKFQR